MTRTIAFLKLALVLLPLILIFIGTAMIHVPAALIVAGLILWLDLNRKGPKQ